MVTPFRSAFIAFGAALLATQLGTIGGHVAEVSHIQQAAESRVGPTGPTPWMRHIQRFEGPLSDSFRALLSDDAAFAQVQPGPVDSSARTSPLTSSNYQVGLDSEPPVRQSNPTVVASLDNPRMAVAAMNDAVGAGYLILRTTNGGRTWTSVRQEPQLPTGEQCSTQTPSLAFSKRDHAFYLAAYCTTFGGVSSVQLWTSSDGMTWTPPAYAATAATNVDPNTGLPDPDIVYSWDNVAVDNSPRSAHYGRVYLTWSKYHILPSGVSNYCPAQVAWTDHVAALPIDTKFKVTQIGPDGGTPHGRGVYTSAWTRIAVQPNGNVLALYAQEDCNSGLDRHLRVARSTDGGRTFSRPRKIDRPGEFADNPNRNDVLPNKTASLGISPAIAVSPRTGRIAVVYQNNVDRATSGADIWVSTSDNGVQWHGRVLSTGRLNPAARNDQFFPWITTDPRGRWRVVWLDNRRDPANHLVDAWEATSRDDTVSWTDRRISTSQYDPDNTSVFGSSLGSVTAIAASNAAVFALWPDARDNAVTRTGIPDLDVWTDFEPVRR